MVSLRAKIDALIEELEELWQKADSNSREIIRNGEEILDVHRAKSKGYADAYSFCIFRLKEMRRL